MSRIITPLDKSNITMDMINILKPISNPSENVNAETDLRKILQKELTKEQAYSIFEYAQYCIPLRKPEILEAIYGGPNKDFYLQWMKEE